jgi:undecaprenyl-diphosphatase
MDELIASLIIAIVQGVTEWLPVSSSGHLVLFEKMLDYQGGLIFDVALHFGTLMAVFVYFGADIVDIVRDLFTGKFKTQSGKLGIYLMIATIPAGIVGFFLKDVFERAFQNLTITALGFAITGVFLLIASFPRKKSKLNSKNALIVGLAQIFSILPGISRSGTTLGTGYILGLEEKQAIKFAFLMSIPIIFGANILIIGNSHLPPNLIWATLVSFITGLLTIHLLYGRELVKRENLKWFALYALALAAAVGVYLIFFNTIIIK